MLILAVTGMPGSGKSLLASELARLLNAKVVVLGDIVRAEVSRRGLPLTAGNVEMVATELRSKYGRGAVGLLAKDIISGLNAEYVVVDGVRSPEEVEIFRSIAPTCVIAVHAAPAIRARRELSRARESSITIDDVKLRDLKNLEYGIGDVIAMSDYMIVNELSAEELIRQASQLAEAIRGGQWKDRCRG